MENKVEKVGEIDGIRLYFDPTMEESKLFYLGYNDAIPVAGESTPCKCSGCKCFASGKRKYSDIKYVVGGTDDLERFELHLEKTKIN